MKVRIFGTSLLAQPLNNVYPNNLLIEMSVIANGLFSHPEHVSTIKQKEEMTEIVQNTRICTSRVIMCLKNYPGS